MFNKVLLKLGIVLQESGNIIRPPDLCYIYVFYQIYISQRILYAKKATYMYTHRDRPFERRELTGRAGCVKVMLN
jgi:hypothetical protein